MRTIGNILWLVLAGFWLPVGYAVAGLVLVLVVTIVGIAAAEAARSSFNLVDRRSALKVDVFVLGDDLLDRRQLERRRSVPLPQDARLP